MAEHLEILALSRGSVLTWQFGPRGGKRLSSGDPLRRMEAEQKSPSKKTKGKKTAAKASKSSVKPAMVKKITAKKTKHYK